MTHQTVLRHHWLIRCYRAQLKVGLRVLTAVWIIPPPIAAAVFAWLRRTEVPKRGTVVKQSIRSKIVIPIVILLGLTALILTLVARWHHAPARQSGTPSTGSTLLPGENQQTHGRLDAWARPMTSNPHELAIAYARAIWTYDTSRHSLEDWQGAVSAYADPTGAAPTVAMSLLPLMPEWRQLEQRKANATVTDVAAETTPALKQLEDSDDAPNGWHAFVISGKQRTVLDTETTVVERQAVVAVVCAPTCKFWSATNQVQP
ncbi:hypothetical protein OG558_24060 [Kribbella sp. NBC_01510]|uniref:hypothetical protein n=1 Tax=Kribbella sp. NBC_01510 TaxID=2903581 RepID=UPI003867B7CC